MRGNEWYKTVFKRRTFIYEGRTQAFISPNTFFKGYKNSHLGFYSQIFSVLVMIFSHACPIISVTSAPPPLPPPTLGLSLQPLCCCSFQFPAWVMNCLPSTPLLVVFYVSGKKNYKGRPKPKSPYFQGKKGYFMIQAWIQSQNFVPVFITCPANILKYHILHVARLKRRARNCVPSLLLRPIFTK